MYKNGTLYIERMLHVSSKAWEQNITECLQLLKLKIVRRLWFVRRCVLPFFDERKSEKKRIGKSDRKWDHRRRHFLLAFKFDWSGAVRSVVGVHWNCLFDCSFIRFAIFFFFLFDFITKMCICVTQTETFQSAPVDFW